MAASILDGKSVAETMRAELAQRVEELRRQGTTPGLGVVLVGNDPASRAYVSAKQKACEKTGLASFEVRLAADAPLDTLLHTVQSFNADRRIHGVLVQLPLPRPAFEEPVLLAVDPAKDVDGFHPLNAGRMLLGLPSFIPCTPRGIVELLRRSGIPTRGKHAVIVGRSRIVGRPLAHLLSRKGKDGDATVTLCHSATPNLADHTRRADLLIAAAGRPHTITSDMVAEGAVVVDVGINRVPDASASRGYRLVGDVDFEAVRTKASAITPVPGGIGPMTIAMLLYNTVEAASA